MTVEFEASECNLLRRPGERRDPYAVPFPLGTVADAFRNHGRRWLWVPAFAGTTWKENLLARSSSHPPCRGVMISISSSGAQPSSPHTCRHPRESGDPVFQRRLRMNRDAAAYWIVRSSRTMTVHFD